MKLLRIVALAFGLAAATAAPAAQNSTVMPTTGPHSASDLMTNYVNPAFLSVLSNYSGSSAPAVGPSGAPVPYQFWFDTSVSPPVLRLYDGSQWAGLGYLNTSSHTWTAYTSEPINAQSASYTLTASDCGKLVSINSSSATTLSLPQATSSFATCWIDVFNRGTGALSIVPTTSTINGQLSYSLANGQGLRIVSDGTNWQLGSSSPVVIGGSRVLLNTITVSGATSITDTTSFLSGYADYEIVIENLIPGTNSVTINLEWQANGSYQTSGYLWNTYVIASSGGSTQYTGSGAIALSPTNVSNVSAYGGIGGTISIFNVAQTNSAKHWTILDNATQASATSITTGVGSGMWPSSGTPYAITGFIIQATGSSNLSGTVKVYGKL